jgi:hypothetical protein
MAERDNLLASIASTTADYREGDLAVPTPEHVDSWVSQFDGAVQIPILREMDHVLTRTYVSRKRATDFLASLFETGKLVGDDPCSFWHGVKFLDIQGGGASQREMLVLFSDVLKKRCGFEISDAGADPHAFVYLDDAIFTGNRVRRDLEAWIAADAPARARVHVITIALHRGGRYYAHGKINGAAMNAGKSLDLTWWRAIELEDRKAYTNSSDVLRPASIPDDLPVRAYVAAMRYRPHLRTAGEIGEGALFSSDAGRQLLEQEFLKAGVRIRQMCENLSETQRPLGHMTLETLGFGSLIATFRNCPNNAPLALWAGDPWYPLFERASNSDTSLKRFIAMLSRDAP